MFFKRIFLEFGVNIGNSAERSSGYCHYSMFFGRHNQYPSLGMYMGEYPTLLLVLWCRKTWNNADFDGEFFKIESTFLTTGPLKCTILLILISMRNMVTSKAVRPGTLSTGIKNPMSEISVRNSVGK